MHAHGSHFYQYYVSQEQKKHITEWKLSIMQNEYVDTCK